MTTRTLVGTPWQEGTFTARKITFAAHTITAGSIVVLRWRYENQASPVGTDATDGTTTVSAGGGQFFEFGGNPTVGAAVFYNVSAGSKTYEVNFSADITFNECWATEWSGLSDTANPVDTTDTDTTASCSATATRAGIAFMVAGNFSLSDYTWDGGSTEESDQSYSGYAYKSYASAGTVAMSATGASGANNSLMVLIKDPVASGQATRSMNQFRQRRN